MRLITDFYGTRRSCCPVAKDLSDIGLFLGRIRKTLEILRNVLDMYIQNEREVQRLIGDYMHERKNKI